jgi:hypothetical protein
MNDGSVLHIKIASCTLHYYWCCFLEFVHTEYGNIIIYVIYECGGNVFTGWVIMKLIILHHGVTTNETT